MSFRVVEKFVSINGEGLRAGECAVFIRFKGCNLACSYCDTAWANAEGAPYEEMTEGQIVEYVRSTGITNVTLTGGEPLLQTGIALLCEGLIKAGCHVEIETNGAVLIGELSSCKYRPSFTLDYKLPGSGMEKAMLPENYSCLMPGDAVKFVAGSAADLERAFEIIEQYRLTEKCRVYISPVFGRIEPAEIVDLMTRRKINGVRLQLQLHKLIWDPDRRGV